MKSASATKGITLLEVMIVLAVIGTLASIAIPLYFPYLERTRSAACLANRHTMQRSIVTHLAVNLPAESLSGLGYPKSLCPSGGVYVLVPAGEARGLPTVACSIHHWAGDETPPAPPLDPIRIPLTGLDGFILVGSGWEPADDGILVRGGDGGIGGSNRLFAPNPLGAGSYSITVKATLRPGDNGGYGIFFDTVVDEQGRVSSGYVLQFDRGFGGGQLIIREWSEDRESSGVPSRNRFNDPAIVPNKSDDPGWWTSTKEITLAVTDLGNGNKRLSVYLDGTPTFSNWEFQGTSQQNTYTGFRAWHGPHTLFTGLSINEATP